MGKNRKISEAQKERIAALKAAINEAQAEFDLFLENSSQADNPNHDKELRAHLQRINSLRGKLKNLSK